MVDQDTEARVRASALAAELSDAQIKTLAGLVETHDLSAGEFLLKQGDRDSRMYLVVSGTLEVCHGGESGGDMVSLHQLAPGEIVGELGFLEDLERIASVRASGNAAVVSLSRDKLESVLESDPLLVYRVMRAIIRSVHRVVGHMNAQHSHMIDYIMR